ncbi:MAG: DUF305 domain-containing protein [Solirubrobacterales bacterium]
MSKNVKIALVGAAALIGLALLFILSMGNEEDSSGVNVDSAFVSQMIPHHESAIEMARIAKVKAEHPKIVELANNIVDSQSSEIEAMREMGDRLPADTMHDQGSGGLGMDDHMMGIDGDLSELKSAKPFDREFIDQMIPHHQGAIRMAAMELRGGEDQEVRDLATAIIDAQAAEIEQMNDWREKWYGSPSPSGGVPSTDGMMDPDEMMDSDDGMHGMDH